MLFLNPTPSPGQVRTYLIKFDSTCGEKCNCPLNTKFCYRNAVLCLLTKSLRNFSLYPYTDIPKFNKVFLSANLDVNRMLRLSKCDTILSVYTLCTCVCVWVSGAVNIKIPFECGKKSAIVLIVKNNGRIFNCVPLSFPSVVQGG